MLGACGTSPPVRYHALSRPASIGTETSGPAQVLVEILPIAVPDGVTRAGLVINDGNGRVTVLESDRWQAPVADDMRQVVADARAGGGRVPPSIPTGDPDRAFRCHSR
jgi:uncharacterized lipoprotein YmbA